MTVVRTLPVRAFLPCLLVVFFSSMGAVCAHACVKPDLLAEASEDDRPALEQLDLDCKAGLRLMTEGQPAMALAHLERAARQPDRLDRSLALPLAEAKFAAGLPVKEVLIAWEAVDAPTDLVFARRYELVQRLPEAQAKALLAEDADRPSAALLKDRIAPGDVRAQPSMVRTVDRHKVGVLLPLTGKLGQVGRQILSGIRLALDDDVSLVVRDSASGSVDGAVSQLVGEGVIGILGPLSHSAAHAAADSAEARQIPLVHFAAPRAGPVADRSWVFRASASLRSSMAALVDRQIRSGRKTFAVVRSNNRYRQIMAQVFIEEVRRAGGRVVLELEYKAGSASLTKLARQLRTQHFHAVFVSDALKGGSLFLRFMAREDIWPRRGQKKPPKESRLRYVDVLGPAQWTVGKLRADDQRYVQGATVAVEWGGANTKVAQTLTDKARAEFNRKPGLFWAIGYEALRMVRSIDARTRESLAEGLHKGRFTGVLGNTRFDDNGEPVRQVSLHRLGKNGFQPVE